MRRADKDMTDKKEIEAVLQKVKVLRLAMCRDGKPYVVPLNFGYENGVVYLHSALEGLKIDILRENPNVCFEVDTDVEITTAESPCGWGAKYRSAIGSGRAEFIDDLDEKKKAMDVLMRHYGGSFASFADTPEAEKALSSVVVIRIAVDEMTGKCSGYSGYPG